MKQSRTIINPTRYHKDGVTKYALDVSLYNSPAARAKRRTDLELRLSSEIDLYNSQGGRVIFITLTYSPENRPYFIDEYEGKTYRIPCFRKSDIDKFTHGIADYLRYHYGYDGNVNRDDSVLPFRYAAAPEYGNGDEYLSDAGIQRRGQACPHYHVLLFFPPEIVSRISFSGFISLIRQYWTLGFIRWSKDSDNHIKLFVTNDFAAKYTSKYCVKDLNFYNRPDLQEYLYDDKGILNRANWEKFKAHAPKYRQSQHIGESLKYSYQTYESHRDGVDFKFQSSKKDGKRKLYKCPLYIQRKTIYYYDRKEERYKRTAIGQEYAMRDFIEDFEDNVSKLKFKFSLSELRKLLSDQQIYEHRDELVNCKTFSELYNYITSILEKIDFRYLYIFKKVYCGLPLPSGVNFWQENNNIARSDFDAFFEFSSELYRCQLDYDDYDDYCPDGYWSSVVRPRRLYDSLPFFEPYSHLLRLYSLMHDIYIETCNKFYDIERQAHKNHVLSVA